MRRSDFIFYLLIFYIFAAGFWWSFLLHSKNLETLDAKSTALWYQLKDQGITQNDFLQSAEYLDLQESYQRKEWMIYGEGFVLFALLVVGVWYTHRSRKKELALAQQQRNFLLSVTHELKSPLASVQLGMETLQKRVLTAEQTQRIAGHALRDTKRLHQLVQNLLLATRVEMGYAYHYTQIQLQELLERTAEQFRPQFAGKIELQLPDAPIWVQGDETTLPSVFFNLVENAIKYAPKSERIELVLQTQGEDYLIEVRDEGEGIAKAERAKIFDKFYRIGNEETRTAKGTGLGLYIVKQVTEAHGGRVAVRENSPQGTVFQIFLPKKTAVAAEPDADI